MVYDLQPNIIIFSDAGPGCRWIGNEHGIAGETCWSTIKGDSLIIGASKQAYLNTGDINGTDWVVGECDVSIRPGWFYHETQDDKVKSLEKLKEIYYGSVGRNGLLLLNLPPDKRGLIHENDVQRLNEFSAFRKNTFQKNLALGKSAKATNIRDNSDQYPPNNMFDNDKNTYWTTDDEVTKSSVEIDLGEISEYDLIVLSEFIEFGQRVKSFTIEAAHGDHWHIIAKGTTIGYKRILKVSNTTANKLRLNIWGSKACPLISSFELYKEGSLNSFMDTNEK